MQGILSMTRFTPLPQPSQYQLSSDEKSWNEANMAIPLFISNIIPDSLTKLIQCIHQLRQDGTRKCKIACMYPTMISYLSQ